MKASEKFFSVRYGWIKQGAEIPRDAMHEAVTAGAATYETKVVKPRPKKKAKAKVKVDERHHTPELEHTAVDSADSDAADADDPSAPSAFYGV